MTSFNGASLPDLVLLAGVAPRSNWIPTVPAIMDAESITILAPSSLEAGTYVIQVTSDDPLTTTPTAIYTLNDGTNDVAAPASDKAGVYPIPSWAKGFCIKTSATILATRTYKVSKSWSGMGSN